jgi:hypothetical protein
VVRASLPHHLWRPPSEGSHAFQEVKSPWSYRPRSSLPVEVLRWLAERLAHLCSARRVGQGGTPPLPLEVRLDALGAVVLDGLSYRRAARMAGICKTEVGEAVCVDGLATRGQRPGGWANQKVLYEAKRRTHTALVDRGFRGLAKARVRWHAPIGDRRTKDQRTPAERGHNRLQAGLRALVEQAIGQLANAWTLRRWRGLLYRVRDVYRAAAALICLGRWIHRIPT